MYSVKPNDDRLQVLENSEVGLSGKSVTVMSVANERQSGLSKRRCCRVTFHLSGPRGNSIRWHRCLALRLLFNPPLLFMSHPTLCEGLGQPNSADCDTP